jgi:creatinine amidohydrolase
MRVHEMNWMQMSRYLEGDDRCVLPIGSVEQHAYLSLATDAILAERLSADAAETEGVPVFPVLNYGVTPYFTAYPGTISIRIQTCLNLVADILDGMERSGFRRILLVNGHGGNNPVGGFVQEWMARKPHVCVRFHNWWETSLTRAKIQKIDSVASHASWMENFAWTRLSDDRQPAVQKAMVDVVRLRAMNPVQAREYLGDGNYGGYYQRSDEDMLSLWAVAVEETRSLLSGSWP